MGEHNDLTSEGRDQGTRSFGNYDLIRRIDMGGMGEVYLARQRTAFQREVAVKIIRADVSHERVARTRFFREAEVSSHLKHDHILPLFEFGEVEGRLFLVTPYISGGTLAQRLQSGPLALAEVQQLFTALVQAVAYIHRRGIVHRDLKPSNILLDDGEGSERIYVRLIDFGIAARQDELASPPLTPPGEEIGTLAYMAPERLNGIAAPSNDIYSLGIILYQMLTGRLPIEGCIVAGLLPASLEAVVLRSLAEKPAERYASADALLPDFERACQELQASGAQTRELSVAPLVEVGRSFVGADYTAPTYAHGNAALAVALPGGRRVARRGRRTPWLAVVPLLSGMVLFVMAGVVFLAFPLLASANVTISPQVHMLQRVYTITARPAQTALDVATASLPALEKVDTLTGSVQTTTRQCNLFFFPLCQQDTAATEQLRQSLISQLSTQLDGELQALHASTIGSKEFTDLSDVSTPDGSRTATVTLTEQGSVAYINDADVQQLARLLLTRELGPHTSLVNSTIRIGTPVVEEVDDLGVATMKVAAAGVEEYQYPTTQVQAFLNHIKGMTLDDARVYLRQQPGVDANSVSISIRTPIGEGTTLPSSTSQIKITAVTPTSLPTITLPVLSTPATTPGSQTPTV